MNKSEIIQANREWENFIAGLTEAEKVELSKLEEPVSSNNLFYYVVTKDTKKFDLAVSRLSKRYLYDEEIIPTVYDFYTERGLYELAFDYLVKCEEYFKLNSIGTPISVQILLDNSESINLLAKYKINLERIRSLSPKNIPKITPDVINDKRHLSHFILNEFIQALRVLKEKIEGIRQITHENRYNDLFQAVLRLRFPIWGWSLHDQARLGTAIADAGSADITIQAGGNNIAVFEAFILRDKAYTQSHILKCPRYVGTINKYYAIVYHLKPSSDFENNWTEYKSDVMDITYPTNFTIDSTQGFIDMISEFDDVNNFKIAKTLHANNIEVFHVMINLS